MKLTEFIGKTTTQNIIKRNAIVILSVSVSLLSYGILTAIIFKHRVMHLSTHYSMPDVDTDAGLWYQWYLTFIHKHGLVYDVLNLESYPFGYDISIAPLKNLIYLGHTYILDHYLGYSWQHLILINNISALLVYPIAAVGAFVLTYYLTKNFVGSFIAGIIYGFCFYAVFMGRGTMSINHIELIPFYFLSLIYYLDSRKTSALAISAGLFGILFRIDAYYAFWSGLFSLLFVVFYTVRKPGEIIKTAIAYYTVLFLVLFLFNIEFLFSQIPIMMNKQLLIQTGRNSNPRGELTSILFYLSLPLSRINRLRELIGPISAFCVIPVYISVLLLFFRRKRFYLLVMSCFLIAVVLSAYIPGFYEINVAYFNVFGMFRGVGRLAMFAALFMALLSGAGINEFMKSQLYAKLPGIKIMLFPIIGIVILMTNLNIDATWYRLTDMSKINSLYSSITYPTEVTAIASYPMKLGSGDVGFPQPYELIGQIIHEKPLAAGLSQFATSDQTKFQKEIKDISDPKTIDGLRKYNINTIFIRNRLLDDSVIVNARLKQDARVQFVGEYSVAPDEKNGRTNSDKSRDISVYQIKGTFSKNQPEDILSIAERSAELQFIKVNAGKYVFRVKDLTDPATLTFALPYSTKWHLYEGDLTHESDLTFLKKQSVFNESHVPTPNYQNQWTLYRNPSSKRSNEMTFTLYFKSQMMIYLDSMIFFITLGGLLIVFVVSTLREHRHEKHQ